MKGYELVDWLSKEDEARDDLNTLTEFASRWFNNGYTPNVYVLKMDNTMFDGEFLNVQWYYCHRGAEFYDVLRIPRHLCAMPFDIPKIEAYLLDERDRNTK